MKNIVIILLALLILITLSSVLSRFEPTTAPVEEVNTTYEVSAIVEGVNSNDGLVLLVDWNGEAWYYEMESESFECGQLVIVEFDSNNTDNIYDDEIVKIRGK